MACWAGVVTSPNTAWKLGWFTPLSMNVYRFAFSTLATIYLNSFVAVLVFGSIGVITYRRRTAQGPPKHEPVLSEYRAAANLELPHVRL